jgi:hypothetical protein
MKPSVVANSLRRIASGIANSKNPSRKLVARDLKRILAAIGDAYDVNEALKASIDEAFKTGKSVELDTGTDDLGLAWTSEDNLVHIELGLNEHEMEEIGAYATPEDAYKAVIDNLSGFDN